MFETIRCYEQSLNLARLRKIESSLLRTSYIGILGIAPIGKLGPKYWLTSNEPRLNVGKIQAILPLDHDQSKISV